MPEHTPTNIETGHYNHLIDVPGIQVGNAHHEGHKTGVTVILPTQPMICAGDVRGGGPGTRETDLLDPASLVQTVNALVLSGGSTYGLAAADAVTAKLGAEGRGFSLANRAEVPVSPIVPCAILYDLANQGDKDWGLTPPYYELGAKAFDTIAQARNGTQPEDNHTYLLGMAGAGYGALAGQEAGGLGSASLVTPSGQTVAALMAVNSFGSVRMPNSKAFWAWPYEMLHKIKGDVAKPEFGGERPAADYQGAHGWPEDTKAGAPAKANQPRSNTTIGVVALSVPMTQAEATRIAIMAQDGLARAIRPVHAPTDGDVVFVLCPPPSPQTPPLDVLEVSKLGTYAADCVARAIARGVHETQKQRAFL